MSTSNGLPASAEIFDFAATTVMFLQADRPDHRGRILLVAAPEHMSLSADGGDNDFHPTGRLPGKPQQVRLVGVAGQQFRRLAPRSTPSSVFGSCRVSIIAAVVEPGPTK